MSIVGFTGTRHGMTGYQCDVVRALLIEHGATVLHHGDCLGSDAQADSIGRELELRIAVHPPINDIMQAFCARPGDLVLLPQPYLVRDCEIVDACTLLIAASSTAQEQQRSGTWATVRYARSVGRRRVVVLPNGSYGEVAL